MRSAPAVSLHADINVAPLIDICLVLLIVFMVITPLIVTGVPLQIAMNADNTIYIDGTAIRSDDACRTAGFENVGLATDRRLTTDN